MITKAMRFYTWKRSAFSFEMDMRIEKAYSRPGVKVKPG